MLEASEGRATGNVEERAGPGGQATVHTVEGRLGLEPRRQLLVTSLRARAACHAYLTLRYLLP